MIIKEDITITLLFKNKLNTLAAHTSIHRGYTLSSGVQSEIAFVDGENELRQFIVTIAEKTNDSKDEASK